MKRDIERMRRTLHPQIARPMRQNIGAKDGSQRVANMRVGRVNSNLKLIEFRCNPLARLSG